MESISATDGATVSQRQPPSSGAGASAEVGAGAGIGSHAQARWAP